MATAVFCAGLIASSLLRPGVTGAPNSVVVPLAAMYGAFAVAVLSLQHTRLIQWCASRMEIYLLGGAVMMGCLSALAARQDGLASVYFAGPMALTGMYLGLVLPERWSAGVGAVQLAAAVGVQIVQPVAGAGQVACVGLLIVTGWSAGVVCRQSHGQAARAARRLARTDLLTGTLNRQGFLERVERLLQSAGRESMPVALLIVDLEDLARVNQGHGFAAGDELLRWVGQTLPSLLPRGAVVGRLSGDDFGVAVVGQSRAESHVLAISVVDRISEHIGSTVGIGLNPGGDASADALLHAAELALQEAQEAELGRRIAQHTIGGSPQPAARSSIATSPKATRPAPCPNRIAEAERAVDLLSPMRGALALMGGGTLVMATAYAIWPDADLSVSTVGALATAWTVLLMGLSLALRLPRAAEPRVQVALWHVMTLLLGSSTAAIMVEREGLLSPVAAAFAVKVLGDAVVLPGPLAARSIALLAPWPLVVAAFGPASALWVLPVVIGQWAAAFLLGRVGRAALLDASQAQVDMTRTDPLTGLLNRLGFTHEAVAALEHAKANDLPFGLIAFDVEGLKAVNRAWGHAAGDELLVRVAQVAARTMPDAQFLTRLSADEFIAVLPLESADDAMNVAEHLEDALEVEAHAFVGWSVVFDDGFDLAALGHAARRRAERARLQRPSHTQAPRLPIRRRVTPSQAA